MHRRFILAAVLAVTFGASIWAGVALAQPSSGHQPSGVQSGQVTTAAQAIALADPVGNPEIQGVIASSAKRVPFGRTIPDGVSVPGSPESLTSTVWAVGIRARSITPPSVKPSSFHDDWEIVVIDQRSGDPVSAAYGPGEFPGWYRNLR